MRPSSSFQFSKLLFTSPEHGTISFNTEAVPGEPHHRIFRARGSFGAFTFNELVCKDFDICYGQQIMKADMTLSITSKLSFLGMIFMLSDTGEFAFEGLYGTVNQKGKYSLVYAPEIRLTSVLERSIEYNFISVALRQEQHIFQFETMDTSIAQFIRNIRNRVPCYAEPQFRSATYEMKAILNNAINLDRKAELKNHYLNSIMHELFNHVLDSSLPIDNKEQLTEADRRSIEAVHEHVLQNLSNPGHLHELAQLAGMNINKLNVGFRQRYGKSVFSYIRSKRMEKARELLSEGKMSIQGIAESLGYRTGAHFTVEFKKVFGAPPSKMR